LKKRSSKIAEKQKSNINVNNVKVEQPFNEFNLFNIKNGQGSNDAIFIPEP